MKQCMTLRFLILYAAIAVVAYFIASTLGYQMIEDHLISEDADSLYRSGTSLVSGEGALSFSKSEDLDDTYSELLTIASAEKIIIRVIDATGEILLDTSIPIIPNDQKLIQNFDYASYGTEYYAVNDFFGTFSENHLNILVPVTRGMRIVGYVSLHESLTEITEKADHLLSILILFITLILLLTLLIFVMDLFTVIRPLRTIRRGAEAMKNGHYETRIDVGNRTDEVGRLAGTLNDMASEIEKTGRYQRDFISNVSHDFRSPLTSIKGFTEAMVDGTIPPELHEKYLLIIRSEAERLEKLTRNTLSLENLDRGVHGQSILTWSDFDINEMIRSSAALFEGSCRENKISFALSLVEGKLMVHADAEKIQQVLYNLFDNAVKFSGKNSTITVTTNIRHGKCRITVEDEGRGIEEEALDKIWDRFYKTDASRGRDKKGTGLGLSIVKGIINAHSQTITVSSTVDVGTKFEFTLDLVREAD